MAEKKIEIGCFGGTVLGLIIFVAIVVGVSKLNPPQPGDDLVYVCAGGLVDAQRRGYFSGAKLALGGKFAGNNMYHCAVKKIDGQIDVILVKKTCNSKLEPSCSRWVDFN